MKRRFLSWAVLVLTMAAVLIVFGITETAFGATLPPPMPAPYLDTPQSGNITDTSIRLSWSASAFVSSYHVYRKPYGGEYEVVKILGDTSYTDTGLKNGSLYSYFIMAVGPGGYTPSNEVQARTKMPGPTNLSATVDSSGEITLTWKDNCNSEDVWVIEYIGPDGETKSLKMVSTTSEQVGEEIKYNFGRGDPGKTYLFWVWGQRTEYFATRNGDKSEKATVTVPGLPIVGKVITDLVEAMDKIKPEAPSGLTATAVSGSAVTLLWTDNSGNEDGFKIERKAGSGSFEEVATAGADSTSYTDTGLSPGTTYHYRVAAYNNRGSSDYSRLALTPPGIRQQPGK
jgi:hypothetical protein